jgi:hypothetical protein
MSNLFIDPAGEYPRFVGDVQLDDPSFELGGVLPEGWKEVQETEIPVAGDGEVVIPADPIEIDGVWTQQWDVRPLTTDEIKRRDAPITAKEKLAALGLTDFEIQALASGLIR